MIHRFAEFELDEELAELRRAGVALPLEPKPFQVLRHLVGEAGRLVSKDELLHAVWPEEHVTESVLHRCVSLARKALGAEAGRVVTLRGRGYRFEGDVEALHGAEAAGGRIAAHEIFLGRGPVLASLRAFLDDARRGRGRVVLVAGEPGIGKTRTVEAFLSGLGGDVAVLVGRCSEDEGAPPFWPWLQVVRGASDALPMGDGEAGRALLERLEGVVEESRGGRLARFHAFDEVARLLRRVARESPAVVVLEDLHWGDAPSLLLLQTLAPTLSRSRVVVVATHRDERQPRDDPFARMRGELVRLNHVRRIALEGLDREQVARFLELALGRAAPDPLVEAVLERTEGNPLFLREMVEWLLAQPQIQFAEFIPSWGLALPDGLRDAIERRIDALGEATGRVLEAAAVIGRSFDTELLVAVHGGPPERVDEALERARRARVLVAAEAGEGAASFGHALMREALLDAMPRGVRASLHARVGEALEKRHAANPGPVLGELAHHFFEAHPIGGAGRALDYAERAADAAARHLAWEEAASHLERAARLLEGQQPPDRERLLSVLRRLGDAWVEVGDVGRSRDAFQRAAGHARSLGDRVAFAELTLGVLGSPEWGPVDRGAARANLRDALAGLPAEASRLRARLLARQAAHSWHWGEVALALDESAEALAMARRLGDEPSLAAALVGRILTLHSSLATDEGARSYDALLEEASALAAIDAPGEPRSFAEVGEIATQLRGWRAARALTRGDAEAYRAELAACIELARMSRHPAHLWLALFVSTSLALLDGRLDDAERVLAEGFRFGQRLNLPWAGPAFLGGALELGRCRGRLEEVAPRMEHVSEAFPGPERSSLLRAIALQVQVEAGDLASARGDFERWWQAGLDGRRDQEWTLTTCGLAETACALDHAPAAAALEAMLAPYAAHHCVLWGVHLYQGSVAHRLARLCRCLGRPDDALRHAEESAAATRKIGALPWWLRDQRLLALLLHERGGPADLGRARELEASAQALAVQLGLQEDTVLRSLGG